jgi:hypothetical protein
MSYETSQSILPRSIAFRDVSQTIPELLTAIPVTTHLLAGNGDGRRGPWAIRIDLENLAARRAYPEAPKCWTHFSNDSGPVLENFPHYSYC